MHPILTALLLGSATANTLAGDWQITPRVELVETYTDNVALSPQGQEKSDFVTEINPGVEVRGKGRQLQANLDYRAQTLHYADDSARNKTHQQLRADAGVEIVEQNFFILGQAAHKQELLTAQGATSLSNIADTQNLSDATTVSVSPLYRYTFGSRAALELRYDLENIRHDAESLSDSDTRVIDMELQSGSQFTRWPWRVFLQQRTTDYDLGGTTELKHAVGELRYGISRQFSLSSRLGYEDNNFGVVSSGPAPKGAFWNAGAAWNPTERTSLEAAVGQRYFGKNTSGSFRHQGQHVTLHTDYQEDVFTSQQLQFTGLINGRVTCVGTTSSNLLENDFFPEFNGVFGHDAAKEFTLLGLDLFPVRSVEPLKRKCLRATAEINTSKNKITIGVFDERRSFQINAMTENAHGADISWDWRVGARTHSVLSEGWQRSQFQNGAREDNFRYTGLALVRQFDPKANGLVNYRHTRRDSNVASDYAENILGMQLVLRFH